jgi:hypothetical protein
MLNTIRFAEGTWKGGFDVGYRVMFGGGLMSSLNRHPNRVIYSSRYASAAAGAYQFMPFTWDLVRRSLGVTGLRTRSAGSRGAVLDPTSQGSWSHRLRQSFSRIWLPNWRRSGPHSPPLRVGVFTGSPVKKYDRLRSFYNVNLVELRRIRDERRLALAKAA